jgi:hypothetical protein
VAFKSRVLDLLELAVIKHQNPALVLPFVPDFLFYCIAQPDNSSKVLSKRYLSRYSECMDL